MVNIISSGSHGNAVLYAQTVLVDCGVPYKLIHPYRKQITAVILTHIHGDHFNMATLRKLQMYRPSILIIAGDHFRGLIDELRNVHFVKTRELFQTNLFKLSAFKLYHDVPNYGFVLNIGGVVFFHATDTKHLDGIRCLNADYYCIESNYDENTIDDIIKEKEDKGLFVYEYGKKNSHLSEQQCVAFFEANRKTDSKLIRLHQ